jgi:hypothetical protein
MGEKIGKKMGEKMGEKRVKTRGNQSFMEYIARGKTQRTA